MQLKFGARTLTVHSNSASYGSLRFDAFTGIALPWSQRRPPIFAFNVLEFRRHYGYTVQEMPATVDILDIGYWLPDGTYEAPEPDYREMAVT